MTQGTGECVSPILRGRLVEFQQSTDQSLNLFLARPAMPGDSLFDLQSSVLSDGQVGSGECRDRRASRLTQ
jgi:hypothetical protein